MDLAFPIEQFIALLFLLTKVHMSHFRETVTQAKVIVNPTPDPVVHARSSSLGLGTARVD